MEKKYFITVNGELLMSGLNKKQLEVVLRHTACNVRSEMLTYSGRKGPTLIVHEDEMVVERYDSVEDECGVSYHHLVETLEGETLLDKRGGDWTNITPNANYSNPVIRGRVEVLGL